MKKAFTLIELLVVIAIIAILAAILFPVFAQAKLAAKKTADLSNQKQLGTSVQIYLTDSDDTMPLVIPSNLGTSLFTMPVDRTPSANPGNRQAFYGNSLYPYIKSYAMYKGPQATIDANPFGVQTPTPVVSHGYNMNPYLNSFNSTASPTPAKTPVYWPGFGDHDCPGYGWSYPLVITADHGFLQGQTGFVYQFQRSGPSCTSGFGVFTGLYETWKYNTFGSGANMAYLDGHAKFVKFGSSDFPVTLTAQGLLNQYWVSNESQQSGAESGCYYDYTLSPLNN